jgi:tetratricopeptide (TPR) repeat protein
MYINDAQEVRLMLRVSFFALAYLLAPNPAIAQSPILKGEVQLVYQDGVTAPAADVKVAVKGTGSSDITDEDGEFRITLTRDFNPGRMITVDVSKPGWVIFDPREGRTPIPSERLTIKMHPFVPLAGGQHERLKENDPRANFEELGGMRGLAGEGGDEHINKINKDDPKARSVHPEDLDNKARGLVMDHKYAAAAKLFVEHVRSDEKTLTAARKQEAELVSGIIREYQWAGDAFYSDYDFPASLGAYQAALRFVEQDQQPELWAAVQVDVGMACAKIGVGTEGTEANQYLSRAVMAYRAALDIYKREKFPQQWAATQNDLGNALEDQGMRAGGKESGDLLSEAVTAFREALKIYTREEFQQQCAATQNNLGNALEEQAKRTSGGGAQDLLTQAVTAFRTALGIYSHERFPQQWAVTQNNLGNALEDRGVRTDGNEGLPLLADAVSAFRAALGIYHREKFPNEWALMENNLCSALEEEGERTRTDRENGLRLLADAVTACRAALEIRTPVWPQQWATSQINLCSALQDEGTRTGGKEGLQMLAQAVTDCRAASQVYTAKQFPQQWADTQNNLGNALAKEGMLTGGEEGRQYLSEAVAAFVDALEVRKSDDLSVQWKQTLDNLGNTYVALGQWTDAVQRFRSVLRVYPNDEEAYSALGSVYHDELFDFEAARALVENWLKGHKSDLTARENYAEALFTVGRFAEEEELLAELLASRDEDLKADTRTALLALDLAALLAQQKREPTLGKLQDVIDLISAQGPDFKVRWIWGGTVHFIESDARLTPVREWLRSLFVALEGSDREAILTGLRASKASLLAASQR